MDVNEESDDSSEPRIYKNFSNILRSKKKFFPFSSKTKPSKYDNYFLLKNDTDLLAMGTENGDNVANHWTCSVQGQSTLYENEAVCHFFKVEESQLNNFACPTSFIDFELLSFENIKVVSDLPNHFLFAVKLKENQDTTDTLREVKVFKASSTSNANDQLIQISLNQKDKLKTCTF